MVKVAPDPPRILQADSRASLSVAAGQPLRLTCISKGGKPAAGIRWQLGGTALEQGVLSSSELEANGFKFTTISTLELQAGFRHTHLD